jgi:hypothetical protein
MHSLQEAYAIRSSSSATPADRAPGNSVPRRSSAAPFDALALLRRAG